jgi:hypothetical protein
VFLGWGAGSANGDTAWTADKQQRIDRYMKSGLRQFYFQGYEWSFLKPVANVTLTQGVSTVALPEDFGGFEGTITISAAASSVRVFWSIKLCLEGQLRESYSLLPTTQGRPTMAALVAQRGTTLTRSNRYVLEFFPLPDGAYVAQFQYYILPDYLSGAFPVAYGGAQHAETILESCLSQAELKGDDMAQGPHAMKYAERLVSSIAMDKRMKAKTAGYNHDSSDSREGDYGYGRHGWQNAGILYNGRVM